MTGGRELLHSRRPRRTVKRRPESDGPAFALFLHGLLAVIHRIGQPQTCITVDAARQVPGVGRQLLFA